jgi:hypothetical protein
MLGKNNGPLESKNDWGVPRSENNLRWTRRLLRSLISSRVYLRMDLLRPRLVDSHLQELGLVFIKRPLQTGLSIANYDHPNYPAFAPVN